MENLAPAGNREALERADAAGADAVYLGYSSFSARAGAGNFGREELADAIRFAHLRHMRVHVTVNTLVKDEELDGVYEVLRLLWELKADAVLIQDIGVLRMARDAFPGLAVHASTQMAIHNAAGVKWCREQGMKRVVLARECSLREISRCAAQPVEIEVFGHGAQCVAVSGLCLFSSMVGQRSGNRGRCAQPCRLEYIFDGKSGAWLSPRDVCLRDELDRLADAGVASVKLEGRLKRPEYVAAVASEYRRGLDSLRSGTFRKMTETEKDALKQSFNRGGFMRGYAFGCEDAGVILPGCVHHQGLEIGTVEAESGRLARIRLTRDLHDGDGLLIRAGRAEHEAIYSGKPAAAGETAVLRLRDGDRVRTGDRVFRLTDAEQMKEMAGLPGRSVRVDLRLRAAAGEKLSLTATDGISIVTVYGETVQTAKTRAATEEDLVRSLKKTGGTVFVPGEVRADTADAFVPVSALNLLRRETLEKLAEARIHAFEPDPGAACPLPAICLPSGKLPDLALVRTPQQALAARDPGTRIAICPEDWREEALRGILSDMAPGEWLALPEVCEQDTLEMICRLTGEYRGNLGGVILGSVGQLGMTWPVPFGAGSGIPVMNRRAAAALLRLGCAFVTASQELTGRELETLLDGNPPIYTQVWGRTQLMLLHHCPARTALGLDQGHAACSLCDTETAGALRGKCLEDRRGYSFPLLRTRLPEGCLVRLENTLPTDLCDRKGFSFRSAVFTTETPEEVRSVMTAFRNGQKTGMPATGGHWSRPIE